MLQLLTLVLPPVAVGPSWRLQVHAVWWTLKTVSISGVVNTIKRLTSVGKLYVKRKYKAASEGNKERWWFMCMSGADDGNWSEYLTMLAHLLLQLTIPLYTTVVYMFTCYYHYCSSSSRGSSVQLYPTQYCLLLPYNHYCSSSSTGRGLFVLTD